MHETILQFISSIIPISSDLEFALRKKMIIESYPRKKILLKPGMVASRVYFILQGMIRAYYMRKGRPVTRLFLKEHDVAISVLSFLQREPSLEYLETIEDCEVAVIQHEDLLSLYRNFVEFNIVGRIMIGQYYCKSEERLMALVQHTAIEKYEYMMKHSPELMNRVPVKYIASYLDMSVENISRIRAKIK